MTNLEGRVIRRRRALPPPDGVRTDLDDARRRWPSGSAAASSSPPTRETVFDELRRASAGGIADYAGITYERIDAEQRRVLAVPRHGGRRARPGHAAAVRRAVRHPRRAGPLPPSSSTADAAEEPDARLPVRADHRPA